MAITSRDPVTGRAKSTQLLINLFPRSLRFRFNPHRYAIEKFVAWSARDLKPGAKILDAGAGPAPYKYLISHAVYEATDFQKTSEHIDFVCSLEKIPRKKESYDAILSTEVLEHVEHPQKVLDEFFRILKKGGKVYLTVPQSWKLHQEPYNFYYFTKYGLASAFREAGFKKCHITPKGGFFWFLSDVFRFNGLLDQYKKHRWLYYPLKVIEYPFTNIIIPFLCFYLDRLDKEKKWTLGYLVVAEK